jgi:hypothetical protein
MLALSKSSGPSLRKYKPTLLQSGLLTMRSCDISDALCALKYRNGGFLSGLTMWSPERQTGPTKIVGPAYTVKYVPVADAAPKLESHYVCGHEL